MNDVVTEEKRSWIMSRIKGKNTQPEILVRKFLHKTGYRFRIHRKDLPGKPDIVLPKYKVVIFVHGCFWHRHENCKYSSIPKTHTEFWEEKFRRNIERDQKNISNLESLGWRVIVVWECEVKDLSYRETLLDKLSGPTG